MFRRHSSSHTALIVAASAASITSASILLLRYIRNRPSKHTEKSTEHHDSGIPLNFNLDHVPDISDSLLGFLKEYTQHDDYEFLRLHVIDLLQTLKSSQLHIYRCIQNLSFLQPKIHQLPHYHDMIHSQEKIVDIGCGLGQEVRKLILDGVKPQTITVMDLHEGYWNYGKRLFLDSDIDNQVQTVFGDLSKHPSHGGIHLQREALGQFQYALALAVLHCLSEDEVVVFLQNVLHLLKSGTHAKLMGWSVGNKDHNSSTGASSLVKTPKGDAVRFLHSVSSLRNLFMEIGFVNVVMQDEELGESLRRCQIQGHNEGVSKGCDIISFGTRKLYFVAEKP